VISTTSSIWRWLLHFSADSASLSRPNGGFHRSKGNAADRRSCYGFMGCREPAAEAWSGCADRGPETNSGGSQKHPVGDIARLLDIVVPEPVEEAAERRGIVRRHLHA